MSNIFLMQLKLIELICSFCYAQFVRQTMTKKISELFIIF